jgi:hypothetical protein
LEEHDDGTEERFARHLLAHVRDLARSGAAAGDHGLWLVGGRHYAVTHRRRRDVTDRRLDDPTVADRLDDPTATSQHRRRGSNSNLQRRHQERIRVGRRLRWKLLDEVLRFEVVQRPGRLLER